MKKQIILLFIFNIIFTFSLTASSKDDIVISNYIDLLINKKFNKAEVLSNNISSIALKEQAYQLANILLNSGQEQLKIIQPKSKNNIEEIFYRLSKSYNLLFTNPYTTEPFENALEAHNLASNSNNRKLQILSLITIQDVYNYEISQSNDDRLIYLKKLEEIVQSPSEKFHYRLNLLLYNLKNVFYKVELNQEFVNEFEKLMTNFEGGHNFWPIYYSTVGVLHEALGNLDQAIDFHQKAISLIKEQPFQKHLKFRSNIRLSEINRRLGEFSEALKYIEEADKYINQADTLRGKYYLNLYASYNYAGNEDFNNAYLKLKKANEQNIKLDYRKNTEQISNLNVKYQTAEKEKQILLEQQKNRRNRNIAFGLVGLLFFGSITFFLIQKNTKRKQLLAEQEKELQVQKVGTLMKEQELASIDAMIEGQEKERQRIANDLHDDLGGMMATVKLHFNTLKDKPSAELYTKTDKLLDEAYQKIRTIAHAKNSGVIAKHGLLKSITDMAQKVSVSGKITIDVVDHGLENRLENSLELTIFRIIQELITNVIKHADAAEATIHLTQHDDSLNIMVEDNGKGFNPKKIKKDQGMGISSIDKRVDHLNGSLNIESENGQGTTIIIDIPL